jgi:hypothetical protein
MCIVDFQQPIGTWGNIRKVLITFGKVSLQNPDVVNPMLLGNLSSVYAKMNQPDSAIYYASIALKFYPTGVGFYLYWVILIIN